jgi:hypothetical protein
MLVAREARNRSRTSHAEQTGFLRGLFARTFCADFLRGLASGRREAQIRS